jgi:hypothetical protein
VRSATLGGYAIATRTPQASRDRAVTASEFALMTVAIFIAPKLQSHFWRAGTILGNVLEKMPIFWEFLLKMPPPKNVYSCQKSLSEGVLAVYRQFFNWFRCRRSVVALQPKYCCSDTAL